MKWSVVELSAKYTLAKTVKHVSDHIPVVVVGGDGDGPLSVSFD